MNNLRTGVSQSWSSWRWNQIDNISKANVKIHLYMFQSSAQQKEKKCKRGSFKSCKSVGYWYILSYSADRLIITFQTSLLLTGLDDDDYITIVVRLFGQNDLFNVLWVNLFDPYNRNVEVICDQISSLLNVGSCQLGMLAKKYSQFLFI